MTGTAAIETLVIPLDVVRRAAYRVLSAWPASRRVIVARDSRIAWVSGIGVFAAFLMAALIPGPTLALAPALLGIPHLAADARYLIVRPRLPRAWLSLVLLATAALVALRVLDEWPVVALPVAKLEIGITVGLTMVGVIWGARLSGRSALAVPMVAAMLAVGVLALRHADFARVVYAHLHSVIAVAAWVILFRRRRESALAPVALLVIGVLVLATGMTLPWAASLGGLSAFGVSVEDASGWLAPGLAGRAALALTLTYVMLQSVHYSTWLGWIPQEEVRGEATLTWRQTVRAARRDLGPALFLLTVAASVAMLAASAHSVWRARAYYLSLSAFHGYVEIALLGFLVMRGDGGAGLTGTRTPARRDPSRRTSFPLGT